MKHSSKILAGIAAIGLVLSPVAAMAATTLTVTDTNGNAKTSIAANDLINVSSTGPVLTSGMTSQSVYAMFSNQSLQLQDTNSITAPEGWSVEYTTDGKTWSTTAPADLKTVKGIRTVGNVNSQGKNQFITTAASTLVETNGSFEGSGGGDGFNIAFAGDAVLNVYHHNHQDVVMDCHLKATGNACWEGTVSFSGYGTGNASMVFWDATNKHAWVQSIDNSTMNPGMLCIDLSTFSNPNLCSTPFVSLQNVEADYNDLGITAQVGTKLYIPDADNWKLMCFDMATSAACTDPQFQMPNNGSGRSTSTAFGRAQAMDGKIYFSTTGYIGCYNPATNDFCGTSSGTSLNEPVSTEYQYPMIPIRNAAGSLLGMCYFDTQQCLNDQGVAITSPIPANLSTWMTNHPIPQWATNDAGIWGELNNKLYLPVGPSDTATNDVYCYDFTTGDACAGFNGTDLGLRIYAIQADPTNGNCMWTNGDGAQITNFTADTGKPGCVSEIPTVKMPYTATVPRMSCSDNGRVLAWDSISFVVPTGLNAADLKVTILDSNGNEITGYVDRTVDANGKLDLTGLTVNETGTQPTIKVTAGKVDSALLSQLTANVKFKADNPELCFQLVATQNCDSPSGDVTAVGNGLIQSAVISTPVSGKPKGDEKVVTLTGTNAKTACAVNLQKQSIPGATTDGVGGLPDTGATINPALALLAVLALVAGAYGVYSTRKQGE